MAGASDFTFGNAPRGANYSAPLIDFSLLAQAPQTYFEGQQRARTTALQNAFPNGLKEFTDPKTGQLYPNAISTISDRLTKIGGAEYATQVLPVLLGQQSDQNLSNIYSGNVPVGPPNPAAPQQPLMQLGQQPPSSGLQNNAAAPTPPTKPTAHYSITGQDSPSQQQAQLRPKVSPAPSNNSYGSPAPTDGGDASIENDPGIKNLLPPGWIESGKTVAQYRAILNAYASNRNISPNAQKRASEAMQAIDNYVSKIGEARVESGLRSAEPTGPMKEAAQAGTPNTIEFERQKTEASENIKREIERGNKAYEGITAQSKQYGEDLKPYLDISRGLMSDPTMQSYTGGGAEFKMAANRLLSAVGLGDPKALAMQETLKKVTATGVLSQININRFQIAEAGESAGRIFKSTIDKIDSAVPSIATSPGGNRALIEIQTRLGEQSQKIAEMARAYVTPVAQGGLGHSHLDPGFDTMLEAYLKKFPAFSKEEVANPSLLTLPMAPATTHNDQQAFGQWVKAMGIKPGALVAVGDGRYKKIPQVTVPVRANTGTTPANAAPQ